MEKFWKYIGISMTVLAFVYGVIKGIFYFGAQTESEKILRFDDIPQKRKVITHVEGALTPDQIQRKYILDSINAQTAIKFRREQDSLGRIRDSVNKYNAETNRLNADQIFQMKEQQQSIIETLKKINHDN